jgi:hypothetical protein
LGLRAIRQVARERQDHTDHDDAENHEEQRVPADPVQRDQADDEIRADRERARVLGLRTRMAVSPG